MEYLSVKGIKSEMHITGTILKKLMPYQKAAITDNGGKYHMYSNVKVWVYSQNIHILNF